MNCKYCNAAIPVDGSYCPACGKAVKKADAPFTLIIAEGSTVKGMANVTKPDAFCRKCDAPLKKGARVCPQCGRLLDAPRRIEPWISVSIFIGVLLISFIEIAIRPSNTAEVEHHPSAAAHQDTTEAQPNVWLFAAASGGDKAALEQLKARAEQGNSNAQTNLGYLYEGGQGVPKNFAQAVLWFRKAAAQGDADAQTAIGYMYDNGEGIPKDAAQAVAWYRKAAVQGNEYGQYNLASMYRDGQGVPKDVVQAARWFRKAASQGNPDAQFNLGVMYRDGSGVIQDAAQAVAWFRKAAAQGNANGQTNLGVMYRDGSGVVQDAAQAVVWFRKAAVQGNAYGQYDLGWMYESGQGIPKDTAQAMNWYRKAAAQGQADAQSRLDAIAQSQVALELSQAASRGDRAALQQLKARAEQGDVVAAYELGVMYRDGEGVPKDVAQAVSWFRKGAEQNYADAENNLGYMYGSGQGVPKDPTQAVDWYRKAAAQGNAYGQYNLGVMYRDGEGLPKDVAQAGQWFRKAAEQGVADAQVNLGFLYDSGQGVPKDAAQAMAWIRKAAAQGQGDAQAWLARMDTNARFIPMLQDNGVYKVPVRINDTITLKFVVDSGASDVTIPADVVRTLMRSETITQSDIIGFQTFTLADGSKMSSLTFHIRSLRVGNIVLQDVLGSETKAEGDLLLGQSFLGRFKSWSIDNAKHALVLQ